jgi:hypothetical protein
MPKAKTKSEVMEEFIHHHGNYYNYSMVEYVNTNTKVIVICPKHGEFLITPNHHKNGVGCRKCYDNNQKINKEEFIKRSQYQWGDIYDYSLFEELPPAGQMIKIICKRHKAVFSQEPRSHYRGHTGCKKCISLKLSGNEKTKGKYKTQNELNEDFIIRARAIHGDIYNYDNFIYKSTTTNGKIVCSKYGEFLQSPSNHLNGTKCPKCSIENLSSGTFKQMCLEKGVNYHRALKRQQAGLSDEKIFSDGYIRNLREINKIVVFDEEFPNIEEAVRVLKSPATPKTIKRWLNQGMTPEEAFERIPNPGYADGIIYLITNKTNEKRYIGLTIQTIDRRWKYHQEQAKANHIKSDESLHAAIREFRAENFKIEQVDSGTTKKDLEKKEREWIKKTNTLVPIGYNISIGGNSGGSNSKPIVIDKIRFKNVKEASEYISKTRDISYEAAKARIRSRRIDVKTPSKPGESYVKSKLYKTWSSIVHIRTNPKSKGYIQNLLLYSKWKDFEGFKEDVKEPEDKNMVFKRIDQSGGYFPDNCKWMTKSDASKLNAEIMTQNGTLIGRKQKED